MENNYQENLYNPTQENSCESNKGLLSKLNDSPTNLDSSTITKYNLDGCSCMGCGCFKSAWTVVLSPAGIAAGMAASATAAVL